MASSIDPSPDAELDAFVDALAERMGRFEKRALETGKKMVNGRAGIRWPGNLPDLRSLILKLSFY